MPDTVTILPETDDTTLCLTFSGAVTKEDHYNNLVVPMRAMIERHGYYNLAIHYTTDFKGFHPDAADQSFNSIREMGHYARRIAYINPTERKLFQTNLTRTLLGESEVRNFEDHERAAAIAWAKSAE